MEMLLDAVMTRTSDLSARADPTMTGPVLLGSGGEGMEYGEGVDNEAELSRKRPRPLSGSPLAADTHQCHICQRSYERADRLSRHLKTHENARRYHCQQCPKAFNRADLLKRHVMIHPSSCDDAGLGDVGIGFPRADRASQACIACAAAKARCEDHKPCCRCQRKKITCEVPRHTANRARGPPSSSKKSQSCSSSPKIPASNYIHTTLQQSTNGISRLRPQREHAVNPVPRASVEHPSSVISPDANYYNSDICDSQAASQSGADSEMRGPTLMEGMLAQMDIYDMHSQPMAGDQLLLDNIMNEILFMPSTADFNNQELDVNFLDFVFREEQFEMFPALSTETSNEATTVKVKAAGRPSGNTRDIHAGYAAFTRSPWLYTPAQRDCVLRDGGDLTLDEDSITSALTPKSTGLTPIAPSCGFPTITSAMRDKMYYLVSTMNRYTSRIPDFPSLDVINQVVEAFFVRQTYQVDNWIHVPTIGQSDIILELVLALVVAGSTVTSVPAIWRMGLVLQDVVRIKLGELWDQENIATRKLQPLQAWMLCLDAGLWSGFQRPMEVTESFAQTLITMMRRGGMLGAAPDTQALIPHESDTGQILEAKWKKWIQRESFKRLSIHLFLHDTRTSIALQKHPLVSIMELTISLPASQNIFLAGSATEWKSYFPQHSVPLARPSLQLIDVMHDITILENLQSEVDVSLCYMAAAHGFWCQIWGFRESWKFHAMGSSKDSVHRLWLVTQQRELYHQVKAFEENLLSIQVCRSELLVVVELLLMILHVSPEELQRFAGKNGEAAASQASDSLEEWSSSEQARRTVWHAGQVLRWAALMPQAELRDFYAIAVHFASLALWAFGHQTNSKDTINNPKSQKNFSSLQPDASSNDNFIVINSEESSAARSFIAGRHITPCLAPVAGNHSDTIVRLDDPNSVLNMAQNLYRKNFPIKDEPMPPLVENMGNLMRDLCSAPGSRFSRRGSPSGQDTSREASPLQDVVDIDLLPSS
ncbi:hypothetical protein N431DRAFT_489671 [Stipitochalara longipes BDJ]|nr:hypothetical protein N431DRAFT_489671 [Stipitochalara longipes BDJ]